MFVFQDLPFFLLLFFFFLVESWISWIFFFCLTNPITNKAFIPILLLPPPPSKKKERSTSMEIELNEKSNSPPKSKRQLPIGLLTKKLSVYQQKIQYRHPIIQNSIHHLAQQCFQLQSTNDRLSFLHQCFHLQHNSGQYNQTTLLMNFVEKIDEAESANGSVWNDVLETWSTIAEAGKFDQIGIPLYKPEPNQKHSPQLLLFKYILVHITEHVVFPQQEYGFVLENVKHFSNSQKKNFSSHLKSAESPLNSMSQSGSFAVAKSTMDELSRFVEATIPLDYDALFGPDVLHEFCPSQQKPASSQETISTHPCVLEGPSASSVGMSNTSLSFSHFAYVGFTLTSLMLRIQVLETKLNFLARSFARHLVMLMQNPDQQMLSSQTDLQHYLCSQFKDLVLTSATLTVSLREVLLSNREKKIGPEALWNRDSSSETSLSSTVRAVVLEMTARVWYLVQTHRFAAVLKQTTLPVQSARFCHPISMDFRDCVVESIKLLPNFVA